MIYTEPLSAVLIFVFAVSLISSGIFMLRSIHIRAELSTRPLVQFSRVDQGGEELSTVAYPVERMNDEVCVDGTIVPPA